jgi:hypothetical protein
LCVDDSLQVQRAGGRFDDQHRGWPDRRALFVVRYL